jgi:uncharacterized glyoxalase superfamily protein PhnB
MEKAGPQRIIPYLAYDDAPSAIDFLCKAFGFEERYRLKMDDGRIGHCEVTLLGNTLMLASAFPDFGLVSPRALEALPCQIMVVVDDVDAHHERARKAGATIAAAPADQPHGNRIYRAVDPEGHRWIFSAPVR